jgi:hypothetical protein
MILLWHPTGQLMSYVDGTLETSDLNPEATMRWRMSRWEMLHLGWRCLRAACNNIEDFDVDDLLEELNERNGSGQNMWNARDERSQSKSHNALAHESMGNVASRLAMPPSCLHKQESSIMKVKAGAAKASKVMREFSRGDLHSGSKHGPVVTKPSQAKAIAMSEARRGRRRKGKKK